VGKGNLSVQVPIKSRDELGVLAASFNQMIQGLNEKERVTNILGKYISPEVAKKVLNDKDGVALKGERRECVVMFTDIRGFTAMSENALPEKIVADLNEYFTLMVDVVDNYGGILDKFIGDAIMAVFGAPVPDPEDPLRAVKAALEMRTRLKKINEAFKARGLPELRTGIGLHSGQVVAGNMGHAERMEYTVIGDTVNLASRLESMTKELKCDVILSEDLYHQVERFVTAEPLHKIKVKGRDQEVMVYRLIDLRTDAPGEQVAEDVG